MDAPKKGRRRNNRRSRFLCCFRDCFRFSTKTSANRGAGGTVLPVNDHSSPAAAEILTSTKEIDVVEEEEGISPFVTHKAEDKTWDKSKNGEGEETWRKQRKLWQSVSLPVGREKEVAAAVVGGEAVVVGGEFGADIIMVALIVMVIWGKIYAILCTAAWLYLIPRFRPIIKSKNLQPPFP